MALLCKVIERRDSHRKRRRRLDEPGCKIWRCGARSTDHHRRLCCLDGRLDEQGHDLAVSICWTVGADLDHTDPTQTLV